jgi:hypothetical protein
MEVKKKVVPNLTVSTRKIRRNIEKAKFTSVGEFSKAKARDKANAKQARQERGFRKRMAKLRLASKMRKEQNAKKV